MFFIVDIIAFVMYLHFKNKVNEVKLQKEVNEELLKYYEKKQNDSFNWLMWCIAIDVIVFMIF